MKILPAAPKQDFNMYIARPDTRWCELEVGDALERVYNSGFLPYSGAIGLNDVFYSARSARVLLPTFTLTSENRRIAKKFEGHLTSERIPLSAFNANDAFYTFCLSYFAAKHGPEAMPHARLKQVLHSGLVSTVVVYKKEEKPVAYVLEVEEGSMAHYWFSFYDLSLAKQSLGMWHMLDCIRRAQERGLTYYYLGTVYGEKALYKTNFEPLEWWSDSAWSTDLSLLKQRAKADI